MTTTRTPRLGFRVMGNVEGTRRLVDAGAALAAHAAADPKAEVEKESYLSAFWFADDFREHLEATSSSKGYDGVCWSPWLWWDIDRKDDLDRALQDARALASRLLDRYSDLDADDLLLFFSGAKGFHVGLPTFWAPAPSVTFHRTARLFAEALAANAGVSIDSGVYDKVRLFRAPNSKHPRTGLHKRRLSLDELLHLSADHIRQLASEPAPFDLPTVNVSCDRAAADWQEAEAAVAKEAEVKATRRQSVNNGEPTLNRTTLDFIRDGAEQNNRHRLLFSAAANLAEFRCPPALAHALLTAAALDSGLTPADTRRQIECGLAHPGQPDTAADAVETMPPASPPTLGPAEIRAALAAMWIQQTTTPTRPPDAPDDDQRAEAEAIAASGGTPTPPDPPAGARFYYADERRRSCPPAAAKLWTWEGAAKWYHVDEFPLPEMGGRK